jgi:acetyl esterase/lipase
VRWLRAHAAQLNVDPDHIGAFGHSAGGHLVECLGTFDDNTPFLDKGPYPQESGKVQAVVAIAGTADFTLQDRGAENRKGSFLYGPEKTLAQRRHDASPINCVTPDDAAFLLIHGTEDGTVPVKQSDRFSEVLRAAGLDVTYLQYEGATHSAFKTRLEQARPKIDAFFKRTLRK